MLLGAVAVVRQRVMPLRDADLGIRAEVELAAEHEGDDAREVGLKREPLQLVHQLDVVAEHLGMPRGRSSAGRPAWSPSSRRLGCGARPRAPSRGTRRPGCDRWPERCAKPREVRGHRIEDAAVLARLGRRCVVRAAVAEQPLEHDARVVLGRQRRRRRPPRQRVQVDAAVAVVAVARSSSSRSTARATAARCPFPSTAAAIWSAEMPFWRSAPSVCLGCTPVSQVRCLGVVAVGAVLERRFGGCARPLTTISCCDRLQAASGSATARSCCPSPSASSSSRR